MSFTNIFKFQCAVCFLVFAVSGANAQDLTADRIYLATKTSDGYKKSRDNKFTCEDTIYLFVDSANPEFSGKTLKANWENPSTGVRHSTSKDFIVRASDKRIWSWSGIVFMGGGGTLDSIMGFLDPAAGKETFIGNWTISLSVEGILKKAVSMEVLC